MKKIIVAFFVMFVALMMIQTYAHEHVHAQNCIYHGGSPQIVYDIVQSYTYCYNVTNATALRDMNNLDVEIENEGYHGLTLITAIMLGALLVSFVLMMHILALQNRGELDGNIGQDKEQEGRKEKE